jgi:hypothetical protein
VAAQLAHHAQHRELRAARLELGDDSRDEHDRTTVNRRRAVACQGVGSRGGRNAAARYVMLSPSVASDFEYLVSSWLPAAVAGSGKQSVREASWGIMASLLTDTVPPLTLSEQLDAMLSGWLDRHAATGDLGRPDEIAKAIVTVADGDVAQVEAFCARWDLTVQGTTRGDGRWAVLIVEGRALPVCGFTEITAMYRR